MSARVYLGAANAGFHAGHSGTVNLTGIDKKTGGTASGTFSVTFDSSTGENATGTFNATHCP